MAPTGDYILISLGLGPIAWIRLEDPDALDRLWAKLEGWLGAPR